MSRRATPQEAHTEDPYERASVARLAWLARQPPPTSALPRYIGGSARRQAQRAASATRKAAEEALKAAEAARQEEEEAQKAHGQKHTQRTQAMDTALHSLSNQLVGHTFTTKNTGKKHYAFQTRLDLVQAATDALQDANAKNTRLATTVRKLHQKIQCLETDAADKEEKVKESMQTAEKAMHSATEWLNHGMTEATAPPTCAAGGGDDTGASNCAVCNGNTTAACDHCRAQA